MLIDVLTNKMLICFSSNLLPAVPFAHNADPTDFSY